MIFKNLQFTLRNFRNRKLFTIVNLAGLTVGIMSASLILIYISYELSFDRFHKNAANIFRVYSTFTMAGKDQSWVQTPNPLGPFLQNKFPDIERTVRVTRLDKGLVSSGDKNFYEDKVILVDTTVFDVFTIPLVVGSPDAVLRQPNSIVLSESAAEKYFGKTDPIGKTLRFNRSTDLVVTGIMRNIPGNTHLRFDMMIPMSAASAFFGKDFLFNPMNTVTNLYLLANKSAGFERLEKSVSGSTKEYNGGVDFGINQMYHVEPLTSIHLHSAKGAEFSANSDIKSIYILSTIALLILLIACINYINLSFSVNSRRTTEIGIRKIMGAGRYQVISLYLTDASVLVGISIIISVLLFSDQLPWFSGMMGADLSMTHSIKSLVPGLMILSLVIAAITGLTSGWISSRVNPMDTFKKPFAETKTHIGKQGILVLFQFVISIVLISSSLSVYRQMKFIRNKNLGFSKEQLLIIPLDDDKVRTGIMSFKQELYRNPNILSASLTSDLPGEMKWVTSIDYDGRDKQIPDNMAFLEIDKDFVRTYGIQLQAGFLPGDTACPYSGTQYLLNEAAAKKFGWKDPIGKKFSCYNGKEGFITGIFHDFNFKSLHEKVEPLFIFIRENDSRYMAVKLSSTSISASVDYISKLWNKMTPDSPFDYFFYDRFYDRLYRKESRLGMIIYIFSAIAIVIACLGLFGLAAFFSERRTKEIGIRKVNGATVSEMMAMLNTKFIKWVFIAFLIATPIAFYAMHKWLQSFAYKTKLSWWIFCLAGIIAVVIALITVSWQSYRAATRNPVEALRYE